MSQENRPAKPAAAIVQQYDPRQKSTATPQPTAEPAKATPSAAAQPASGQSTRPAARPVEIGGPSGPEPTRYGDWERNGRVSDF